MSDNPIVAKLLDKSKEAFIMAIEVYNKPTIRYRIEGFSFFICNAWELMLKAHLINAQGDASIYYKDNPDRTITLEVCVRKIFTNDKAPLRLNLEKIIELRNTSTHFIVEEYEMVYIPLFQACIFNFNEKMMQFHSIDMTTIVPQNFLTLAVGTQALDAAEVRAKYSGPIAERLLHCNGQISPLIAANNSSFAIRIDHRFYLTKKKSEATDTFYFDKDASEGAIIIKDMKDPNDTHKYTVKALCQEVNDRLLRAGITLLNQDRSPSAFNKYQFGLFNKYFDLKSNPKFCYTYRVNTTPTYSYSIQTIDLIVDEIKKDPENIIRNLREKLKK